MVKMPFNLFIDSSLIADSYSTSGIKEYSGFDDIQPLRLILLHKMKYKRHSMLLYRWASVGDSGPMYWQNWFTVLFFLGNSIKHDNATRYV